MITDAILLLPLTALEILRGIYYLITPGVVTLNTTFDIYLTQGFSYIQPLSNYIDLPIALLIFLFIFAFELSIFGFKVFNWILKKIPGLS